MGGITIAIQANPDISAIVVGGMRLVIDVAVKFVSFFTRLSEMLCRLGDFLEPLAEYAKASAREELVLEALANVYRNLLQFCKQAHEVFTEKGLRRNWVSWRNTWRILWIPFEEEFGKIESDMQHHLDVLRHSAQALVLNVTLEASRLEKNKERGAFFSIVTPNSSVLLTHLPS
jgi:ankyrin repeat domain-containing protein 50